MMDLKYYNVMKPIRVRFWIFENYFLGIFFRKHFSAIILIYTIAKECDFAKR